MDAAVKRKTCSIAAISISAKEFSYQLLLLFISLNSEFLDDTSIHSSQLPINSTTKSQFIIQPFVEEDVWKELNLLDIHKAARPDCISGRFLNLAADVIAAPLTKIFIKSLEISMGADEWKWLLLH